MATFSSDKVTTRTPTRFIEAGVFAETAFYSGSASFATAGDVIQMVKVPAGARVTDIMVASNRVMKDASGSAASFHIQVGDGIDADRYIQSASGTAILVNGFYVAPGEHHLATAKLGYEYSADDTIDITIVDRGSAQTSNAVFRLYVSMVVDN